MKVCLVQSVLYFPRDRGSLGACMGGEFKKCPYCAEEIRAEAVVCRFCHRELQQAPVPAGAPPTKSIVQDGVAKDAERRSIQSEVRRRRALARLFAVASGFSGIVCFVLAYDATIKKYGQVSHSFGIWALLCIAAFFAYLVIRPRYTGAECPNCHGFACRRGSRSGCVSASYFLKCEDCQSEFGGTGGGCACLGMIVILGSVISGIAAMILISLH